MEEEEPNRLYPTLPTIPEYPERLYPQSYRLTQISEIKKYFEDEIEFRRRIFSKYKKAFNVITGLTHCLNFTSVAAGSVGISALAGVITIPIGLALGSVIICTALISSGLSFEKKYILKKIIKHEKISTLAISKLNTINNLVSKALTDSAISVEEFALIIKEKEKYVTLKNSVRKEVRESADSTVDIEALKNTFFRRREKTRTDRDNAKAEKTVINHHYHYHYNYIEPSAPPYYC